jgi:transposase, IS5 family
MGQRRIKRPPIHTRQTKAIIGYKAHVSSDAEHHLIQSAVMTSARVYDGDVFEQIVPEETEEVYADKAYDTKANKAWLRDHGIENGILKKQAHHIKLTRKDVKQNHQKGVIRRNIERIFGHMKLWQHYRRARYLGLAKNKLELTLKAVAYNLKRLAKIIQLEAA